jgi:hypothetical protein
MLRDVLLTIHIAGGTVALLALLPAVVLARGTGLRVHPQHRRAGLVYVGGMIAAVGTAYPLAVLLPSVFLGAVGVFTTYLVASGWRWMRRGSHATATAGRGLAVAMLVAGAGMVVVGAGQLRDGDGLGVALLVFAGIGGALAVEDLRALRVERPQRRDRMALHLGRMLGGAIATITAVLVVNVTTDPVWLAWIAPTVVISPVIAWRTAQVLRAGEGTVTA